MSAPLHITSLVFFFLVCLVFSISCVYGILVCLIGSHTVSGGGHTHQISILCHLHQWLDFLILFLPQALQVLLTFSLWATLWIRGESWVPLYCYTTYVRFVRILIILSELHQLPGSKFEPNRKNDDCVQLLGLRTWKLNFPLLLYIFVFISPPFISNIIFPSMLINSCYEKTPSLLPWIWLNIWHHWHPGFLRHSIICLIFLPYLIALLSLLTALRTSSVSLIKDFSFEAFINKLGFYYFCIFYILSEPKDQVAFLHQ